jgi:uncharacterized protein involved in exopolysaccharide biosynthesis
MELRELIAVFRKQKNFFLGGILLFVFFAWVWQRNQAEMLQSTLLINIGRAGVSGTADYTYDSFYRLQADERFADTVVRWLASPRVVEDIYREAHMDPRALGLKDLSRVFEAGRLSSQMVTVSYQGSNEASLKQLATATVTVLNHYTDTLNTKERENSWFVVIGSDPVIRDGRVAPRLALLVGLVVGIFLSFWGVLLRHYYQTK